MKLWRGVEVFPAFAVGDTADIGYVLTAGWLSDGYSITEIFSSGFSYRQVGAYFC